MLGGWSILLVAAYHVLAPRLEAVPTLGALAGLNFALGAGALLGRDEARRVRMASREQRETLHQSIEFHKGELRLAVDELRVAARPWTALSEAIRARPLYWLLAGGAVGFGCCLGMRGRR